MIILVILSSLNIFSQESLSEEYIYSPEDRSEDWTVDNAYYEVVETINPKKVKTQALHDDDCDCELYYGVARGPISTREFRGNIHIREVNSKLLADRYTVVENVRLSISLKGAVFRAGMVDNRRYPLKGLDGLSLRDLFDSPFRGGKLLVQLGFFINLVPNFSYVVNSSGISIPDLEQMVSAGFGIGIEAAYVSAQFFFRDNLKGTQVVKFHNEEEQPVDKEKKLQDHFEILDIEF